MHRPGKHHHRPDLSLPTAEIQRLFLTWRPPCDAKCLANHLAKTSAGTPAYTLKTTAQTNVAATGSKCPATHP